MSETHENKDPEPDMAKVTQMLDTGWTVSIIKHNNGYIAQANRGMNEHDCFALTPEAALTKLAYQIRGEKR